MLLEIIELHVGEMDADQLWETTINPDARRLNQITMEDCKELDKVFDTLMGVEVEPRKEFIIEHSELAVLDI